MRKLNYQYNCVCPRSHSELAFIDENMRTITRETAMKYLNLDDVEELERAFGYDKYSFKMKDDWAVKYFKSKRKNGDPVYGIIWSCQDYIFY